MGKNGTPVRKKARRTIGGGGLEPAALAQMGGVKLRDRFQQVFGQPTTSNNLEWLRKRLAQPLSAHAEAEAGAAAVGAQPSTHHPGEGLHIASACPAARICCHCGVNDAHTD